MTLEKGLISETTYIALSGKAEKNIFSKSSADT